MSLLTNLYFLLPLGTGQRSSFLMAGLLNMVMLMVILSTLLPITSQKHIVEIFFFNLVMIILSVNIT